MSSYTTLQRAKQQMNVASKADDYFMSTLLEPASNAINEYCGQNFDEQINEYGFSGEVGSQNPTLFLQQRPLLSCTTLFNGTDVNNNPVSVSPGNFQLLPLSSYTYPKAEIRLTPGNFWAYPYNNPINACGPPYSPLLDRAYAEDAVLVLGLWGFHRQYPTAWQDTGYSLSGAVTTGQTTITTTQAQPLYNVDVGDVLKITPSTPGASAEYMLVTGPVANSSPQTSTVGAFMSTNTLTVQRAYNNSVLQAFNGGEEIFRWRAESTIVTAAAMLAAWLYETRLDATGNSFQVTELGTVTISVDLPPRVKRLLSTPFYNSYYGKA